MFYSDLPFSDTVIDPRAVVIESIHANVADVAMSASWSSYRSAVRAEAICLKAVKQLYETHLFVLLYHAWILQPSSHPKNHTHSEK